MIRGLQVGTQSMYIVAQVSSVGSEELIHHESAHCFAWFSFKCGIIHVRRGGKKCFRMHRRSADADTTPWPGPGVAHVLVLNRRWCRSPLPPGSNRSIRGKEELWVGGPDRTRGRAEQCSGEGLSLEEVRGRGVVSNVISAVRERVADGGRHCR